MEGPCGKEWAGLLGPEQLLADSQQGNGGLSPQTQEPSSDRDPRDSRDSRAAGKEQPC